MSSTATIWHCRRCSKARKTLAILRDQEVKVTVRYYQEDPPDLKTLADTVEQLGIEPRELVRTKDAKYRELEIDEENFDDSDWLQLLADHPELIERPVVFTEAGAVIGRPPEKVFEILPERQEG